MYHITAIQKFAEALETDNTDKILKRFYEEKFDINMEGRCGNTPLHVAASLGKSDFVRLFLIMGANPNQEITSGKTALTIACSKDNIKNAEILLQHPMTLSPRKGPSLFFQANQSKNPSMAKNLIKYGMWPEKASDMLPNPSLSLQELIAVNIHVNPRIRERYLSRDKNLITDDLVNFIEQEKVSYEDNEALIDAIKNNDPRKLLSLLMNGCIFSDMGSGMDNEEKHSFLGYAAKHGYLLIAKILVIFGGAILTQPAENSRAITAYQIAQENSQTEIANFISAIKLNRYALLKEYFVAKEKGPEQIDAFFEGAENQLHKMYDDLIQEVESLTEESADVARMEV